MRNIMFLTSFVFTSVMSCCQSEIMSKIKIIPLHPYSSSPTNYDKNTTAEKSFVVKFYFIEGACKATDELSNMVDAFIIESIKKDEKDFNKYGGYYIYFYRGSKNINEHFREQVDGIFSNTLDEYNYDLLFRYEWNGRSFKGCSYYRNGKIFKTIWGKNENLFRQTFFPPKGYNNKVQVEEIPKRDSTQ